MLNLIKHQLKSTVRDWHAPAMALALAVGLSATAELTATEAETASETSVNTAVTLHKTIKVGDLDIFYREAGPKDAPTILLLHGFPTSSQMFAELMEDLGDEYHLVAPDYPGFGNSSMPKVDEFEYSFDNLADVVDSFITEMELDSYALYVMDYGAPVGYRIATAHPERVTGLIVQNGNAYVEGLREFWDPIRNFWADRNEETTAPLAGFLTLDVTKWQWTHGTRNAEAIDPDNWVVDQYFMDREGNKDIQLELFYSYSTNPPLYPEWQEYFRTHQPPTLVVWGKNDYIFPAEGAYPYQQDLTNIEFHLLDTGHFALEEDGEFIAAEIRDFLARNVE